MAPACSTTTAPLLGRPLRLRDRSRYVEYFVNTLARSNDEAWWRGEHDRARRQRLAEGRTHELDSLERFAAAMAKLLLP